HANDSMIDFADPPPAPHAFPTRRSSDLLLSDYDSSTSCSLNGAAATATNSASLSYGDKLDCTITNKRLPRLKITKALDPTTDGENGGPHACTPLTRKGRTRYCAGRDTGY